MKIRKAGRRDVPKIIELVTRLAEFEKLTPPDEVAVQRYIKHGFGKNPFFRVLLVEDGPKPVAYAFYFFTYSTFLARPTLYLEDLFVLPEYRKRGVGQKLMTELASIAKKLDCGRMEWCVLDWNENAIRFYDRLGARHLKEWFFYRLDRKGIEGLANGRS
jgi:GNAT superfamily N-acetyltransferase